MQNHHRLSVLVRFWEIGLLVPWLFCSSLCTLIRADDFKLYPIHCSSDEAQAKIHAEDQTLVLTARTDTLDKLTDSVALYARVDHEFVPLEVTMLSFEGADPQALGGLMLRNSRLPNAAYLFIGTNNSRELVVMTRPSTGGNTMIQNLGPASFPLKLRVLKNGLFYRLSYRLPDKSWQEIPEGYPGFDGFLLVGPSLASGSHIHISRVTFSWAPSPSDGTSKAQGPEKAPHDRASQTGSDPGNPNVDQMSPDQPEEKSVTEGEGYGVDNTGKACSIPMEQRQQLAEALSAKTEQAMKSLTADDLNGWVK